MTDTFHIGAYWKNRKQLLDNIINPTVQTLKELGEIDEQFLNLYELGNSRKQALENKVSVSSESIKKLYQKRSKKNDFDQNGYSKIGYRLSLWTGHTDYESSAISFNAGSSSTLLTDLCLINIPTEGTAKNRLLQFDKVKEIINLLIQKWNPDIIVLNSRELSNALDTTNEVGWVTYTKKLKGRVKLNDKVVHEEDFSGGHLFYLKTENDLAYDYSLMSHLLQLKKEIISA